VKIARHGERKTMFKKMESDPQPSQYVKDMILNDINRGFREEKENDEVVEETE
jgi:hypothetical protein